MNRFSAIAILIALGAGWGITQPFAKIAVDEGYRHFGMIFWQFVIAVIILGILNIYRGKGLPLGRKQVAFYLLISVIGTLLPNAAGYEAARELPAGVLSILISTVPMFAFPIAIAMRLDSFSWVRLLGLLLGFAGVAIIAGPTGSLPSGATLGFVMLAVLTSLCYAFEGNIVAKWGMHGADAIQVLLGASIIGVFLSAPLAIWTGSWIPPHYPFVRADYALFGSSAIHAVVYCTYVWFIGKAGPVFASQTGYLVTGFGIFWAMLILSESYSGWIWGALAFIMVGVTLVKPREA